MNKEILDRFVYILFAVAVCGLAYSIYTKDILMMIPTGFGTFTFGGIIQLTRHMNKRIREIENEQGEQDV